jgi:hypothetical protein
MNQAQLINETIAIESRPVGEWRGPLFLVGIFRSGTSLLYALLNQHPDIAVMYEAEFLRLRPYLWSYRNGGRWTARCDSWNQAFQRHAIDPNEIPLASSDLKANIEEVYREYARQKNARIWGDKSPNYHDFLNRLARDFPEAKFVIIWRDPLNICRSMTRAAEGSPWFNRIGMNHRILIGCRRLRLECDRLIRRGSFVYQVQYEDLVRDPVRTMKGICSFLGILYVPSMASLEGADRSAIYDGEHHSLVKGERVIAAADRAEILPERFKGKIQRYLRKWQRESGGAWPMAASLPQETPEPSLPERIVDQIWYRSLRGFDFFRTLSYFAVPSSVLKMWRRLIKSRGNRREVRISH